MHQPALLYLHLPFCRRKCAYCDFFSESGHARATRVAYVGGLIREMERTAAAWAKFNFATMYLGGGTPSLLPPEAITRLLTRARELYHFIPRPEITMEINPATLTYDALESLRESGLNRLSVGVQSFHEHELQLLGRSHTVEHSRQIIAALKQVGYDNYNLDLIYGLPGQSLADWRDNLQQAIAAGAPHISAYLLQLEESSPLGRQVTTGELTLPDEDTQAEMYALTRRELRRAGYDQYEISNFARPGYACRHNTGYWQMIDYLGLGAGAVSRRNGLRYKNREELRSYLPHAPEAGRRSAADKSASSRGGQSRPDEAEAEAALPLAAPSLGPQIARDILEEMDAHDLFTEALILGLRMTQGVDLDALQSRFGAALTAEQRSALHYCREAGLLLFKEETLGDGMPRTVCLSDRGWFLANQVFARLI